MSKKITIRIDGIEKEWDELPYYLSCTRSEFIRECIVERVNKKDELTELQKKHKEKTHEKGLLDEEIIYLEKKMNELEELQQKNLKDEILINTLLDTCRTVANTEGLTEERVIAIANDKINYKVLINRLRDEGFKIKDIPDIQKSFTKDENGNQIPVKSYERKEKSSLESVTNAFKRNYNRQTMGDPIKYLESEKERYETMCKNVGMTYDTFKKHLKKYYNKK
ncbi:hypothetical protein [Methanobrevibacter sp.]|uniref:hypothetical protein n=1 Tax=Methanobrevibacter sp. TaxID=66852 RepID=UPI0038911945